MPTRPERHSVRSAFPIFVVRGRPHSRVNTGSMASAGWPAEYKTFGEYAGRGSLCSRATNRPAPPGGAVSMGNAMRQLATLGCAILLAACGGNSAATEKTVKEERLKIFAQQEVRARLRDPGSAEFSNLRVSWREGQPFAICGEVRSRNGFGGMNRQRFIAGGAVTGLEEDFAPGEFEKSWVLAC